MGCTSSAPATAETKNGTKNAPPRKPLAEKRNKRDNLSHEWHVEPAKALDQYACSDVEQLADELRYLDRSNSMFDYTSNEEYVELRALLDEPLGRSHFLAFADLTDTQASDLVKLWLLLHQYHHMEKNTLDERLETAKSIYRNYFSPRSMSFSEHIGNCENVMVNIISSSDTTDADSGAPAKLDVQAPVPPGSPAHATIGGGVATLPEASRNFPKAIQDVILAIRDDIEMALVEAIHGVGSSPRAVRRPRGDTRTEIIEAHCAPVVGGEQSGTSAAEAGTASGGDGSLSLHLFMSLQSVTFTSIQPLYHKFKETKAFEQYKVIKRSKYNHVEPDDFIYSNILGKGGFGQVVHVVKKSTCMHYAMKIQAKDTLLKTWKGKMQHVEIERDVLVAHRSFPFIVSLRYAFQTESHAFLCLDLAENGSLRSLIADTPGFQLQQQQVRLYAAEIVLALECLHTHGIIYRDLKPENVLLQKDGHILLADMGLAGFYYQDKYFEEDQLSHRGDSVYTDEDEAARAQVMATEDDLSDDEEGEVRRDSGHKGISVKRHDTDCGTPMYRPPEMLSHESYGNGVDWFMLGVFTFECLCGFLPFEPKRTCITDSGMIVIETDEQELNLLRRELVIPAYIDKRTKSFLEGLLDLNPDTRLGSGPVDRHRDFDGLKNHEYFWQLAGPVAQSVSWEKVLNKEYNPVYIPPEVVLESKKGFKDFDTLLKFMKKQLRKEIEETAKRKNIKANFSVQGLKEGNPIEPELEHYFDNWDYIDAKSVAEEIAAKTAVKSEKSRRSVKTSLSRKLK